MRGGYINFQIIRVTFGYFLPQSGMNIASRNLLREGGLFHREHTFPGVLASLSCESFLFSQISFPPFVWSDSYGLSLLPLSLGRLPMDRVYFLLAIALPELVAIFDSY